MQTKEWGGIIYKQKSNCNELIYQKIKIGFVACLWVKIHILLDNL